MAKILRKTAKIFGGSLVAGPGGIGEFGSLSGGTPAYSLDPAVIQALGAWANGWGAALVSNFPAQEDMNSVDFVNSYNTAYLLQQGIAEYDAGTTYYTNSFCSYGGLIYISLIDDNTGNEPGSSPSDWVIFKSSSLWGGTDTGSPKHYAITITGFPANVDIAAGTSISFVIGAGNTNVGGTGASFLAINGQAEISLYNSLGVDFKQGCLIGGQIVNFTFDGAHWVQPGANPTAGLSAPGELEADIINADKDDWNPGGWGPGVFSLITQSTGALNITGLKKNIPGQVIVIFNGNSNGGDNLTLKDHSASSTQEDRFANIGGTDVVLTPLTAGGSPSLVVQYVWSVTFNEWIQIK